MRVGEVIDGQWEVREIREGGLGQVYVAYDAEWQSLVAIKTFKSALSSEARDRFQREACNWISLPPHEHVVRAYFYQVIAGTPYLFMEYVPGKTLRQTIEAREPLCRLVAYAIEVASGLQFANETIGLIHRDVKPDNVMVTVEERLREYRLAKLTDFGLSKVVSMSVLEALPGVQFLVQNQSLATTIGGLGSLFYVSPEQADDAYNVDLRSDIYSFGVMMYEMFTGRLPFHASPTDDSEAIVADLLFKHATEPPMSPRHIAPGIPRKLEKVILRCMEKDPGRRFQTYSELISELEATYRVVRDPAVLTSCDFFEIVVRPRYSETAILNNRACSYMELGHHVEALALFDQVLKQAPEDVHALCNKGHALEQLNRYHEAIGCYDRALEIDPGDGQACLDKANSLAALGRHEGALPCYEGALDRNPQDAHTWYNMGNTLVLHDSCFWGWVFVSQHLHRGARDPVEERFDEEVQRAVDGG